MLFNRFTILERHGRAVEASARKIDDCDISCHIDESGCTVTRRLADMEFFHLLGAPLLKVSSGSLPVGTSPILQGPTARLRHVFCKHWILLFLELGTSVPGLLFDVVAAVREWQGTFQLYSLPGLLLQGNCHFLGMSEVHCVLDVLIVGITKTVMSAFSSSILVVTAAFC